jgi:hypothetical protein
MKTVPNNPDRNFDRKQNKHVWKLMHSFEQKCTLIWLEKPLKQGEKPSQKCQSLSSTLPVFNA